MPRYHRQGLEEDKTTTTGSSDSGVIFPADITRGFSNPNSEFDASATTTSIIFKPNGSVASMNGSSSNSSLHIHAGSNDFLPMVNLHTNGNKRRSAGSSNSGNNRRHVPSVQYITGKLLRPFSSHSSASSAPAAGNNNASTSSSSCSSSSFSSARRACKHCLPFVLWNKTSPLEKTLLITCTTLLVLLITLLILFEQQHQQLHQYENSPNDPYDPTNHKFHYNDDVKSSSELQTRIDNSTYRPTGDVVVVPTALTTTAPSHASGHQAKGKSAVSRKYS